MSIVAVFHGYLWKQVQEQCRVEEENIAALASSAEQLKSDSSFGRDDDVSIKLLNCSTTADSINIANHYS